MPKYKILSIRIQNEEDIVLVRQRARQIAQHLGFVLRDQTAISTAVSEISRNAYVYSKGGTADFFVDIINSKQYLIIEIKDNGPGIKNLDDVLTGMYKSKTGMGMGIVGSRRLMDLFSIESDDTGTFVKLGKELDRYVTASEISKLSEELLKESSISVYEELKKQNQELLSALEDISKRQDELINVNRELEETNRGVVALYAELDEKAEHLRNLNELRGKFFSNMSHEFKTPLNSILALIRMLSSDQSLTEENKKQLQYIKRSAENLLDLIVDLLDIAKIEAGKYKIKLDYFTIDDLFASLRGMLRPLLVNPNVNLIFDNKCGNRKIYSDESKVSQIMRNFISNAIKFTYKGEIKVSAWLDDIDDKVIFSVCDTGIGIDPMDLAYIFEEFTQVDSAAQKNVKGTGLGLPLSKKLATLLKGEVFVKSKPGEGSTFYLSISVTFPIQDKEEVEEVKTVIPADVNEQKIQLLLIEKSDENSQSISSLFINTPYNILNVKDIEEANDVLQLINPPVIIISIPFPQLHINDILNNLKERLHYSGYLLIISNRFQSQQDFWIKAPDTNYLLNLLNSLPSPDKENKLLCIDDQEISRYLIKELVVDLNFQMLEADTGEEGLMLAQREHPDLIFLDLNMPGIDGYDVLKLLKNDESTKDLPVIVITSKDLTTDDLNEFKSKCNAIVSKHLLSLSDAENILQDITLLTISLFKFEGNEQIQNS